MNTDSLKEVVNAYEKPEMVIFYIQPEKEILKYSEEDPDFEIVPGLTDEWD